MSHHTENLNTNAKVGKHWNNSVSSNSTPMDRGFSSTHPKIKHIPVPIISVPNSMSLNGTPTLSSKDSISPRSTESIPPRSTESILRSAKKGRDLDDHRTNVWIRHALLTSVLSNNSKPKYGSASSSVTLSFSRDRMGQGHDQLRHAANSSDTMSACTEHSSVIYSSSLTHSARWGWVKASLAHFQSSSDINHNNSCEDTATTTKSPPPKNNDKNSVTFIIIDLESEFVGQTVVIPKRLIKSFDNNMNNKNDNVQDIKNEFTEDDTIFGGSVLMANPWVDFTSIPVRSTSHTEEMSFAPKWISPRGGGGPTTVSPANNSFRKISKSSSQGSEIEDYNEDDGQLIVPPSDLTHLTNLHEPAVVFSLRHRYAANEIYTSTGPILLALNPFKEIKNIYSEEQMRRFWDRGERQANGSIVDESSKKQIANSSVVETKLEPHVYGVADDAFRSMMRALEDYHHSSSISDTSVLKDQSILVSGESGAGKTVTTKFIMKYLAALSKRSNGQVPSRSKSVRGGNGIGIDLATLAENSSGKPTNIEQQVLESNPILESFGNARTLRNDNSSRFGKFIEIKFTSYGKLVGASIDSYLLEKVRLVQQASGERNYHIFYEILSAASSSERTKLIIESATPGDFKMTFSESGTYKRRDGVKDEVTFTALRKAMNTMGFDAEEQWSILEIVCALLHLSNLTFTGNQLDQCSLDKSNTSLFAALKLLGISLNALEDALCSVKIEAGGDKVVRKLGSEQAMKALEALMKATYGALFTYLVQRVNHCIDETRRKNFENADGDSERAVGEISNGKHSPAAFIGVLDIFGFESFGKNSFEQLCINYCNESLQQQFNRFVFQLEQAEYEKEQIAWKFIEFPDNQNILDIIDNRKNGILSILDENSFLTQCTDQTFAQAVYKYCAGGDRKDAAPISAKTAQRSRGLFTIHHYAGAVEYDCYGFIEKNKDELPKETLELLLGSTNHFLNNLATILSTATPDLQTESRGGRPVYQFKQNALRRVTVGGQFSSQLHRLRQRIDATAPHYIRCLKPNDQLIPDNFDSTVIADQLRCAGILEAVRVSRVGYPQRYSHARFVYRYQSLAIEEMRKYRLDASYGYSSSIGFESKPGSRKNVDIPLDAVKKVSLSPQQECKILVGLLSKMLSSIRNVEEDRGGKNVQSVASTAGLKVSTKFASKKSDLVDVGIQIGVTKVFLRQNAFDTLERLRGKMKAKAAVRITSFIRMILARKSYIMLRDEHRSMIAQRNRLFLNASCASKADNLSDIQSDWEGSVDTNVAQWLQKMKEQGSLSSPESIPYAMRYFKWKKVDMRWVRRAGDEDGDDMSTVSALEHDGAENKNSRFHWSHLRNVVTQSPWILQDKAPSDASVDGSSSVPLRSTDFFLKDRLPPQYRKVEHNSKSRAYLPSQLSRSESFDEVTSVVSAKPSLPGFSSTLRGDSTRGFKSAPRSVRGPTESRTQPTSMQIPINEAEHTSSISYRTEKRTSPQDKSSRDIRSGLLNTGTVGNRVSQSGPASSQNVTQQSAHVATISSVDKQVQATSSRTFRRPGQGSNASFSDSSQTLEKSRTESGYIEHKQVKPDFNQGLSATSSSNIQPTRADFQRERFDPGRFGSQKLQEEHPTIIDKTAEFFEFSGFDSDDQRSKASQNNGSKYALKKLAPTTPSRRSRGGNASLSNGGDSDVFSSASATDAAFSESAFNFFNIGN